MAVGLGQDERDAPGPGGQRDRPGDVAATAEHDIDAFGAEQPAGAGEGDVQGLSGERGIAGPGARRGRRR